MYQCGFFLAALLASGCQGDAPPLEPKAELPTSRAIATVYKVTSQSTEIPCFRYPDATSPIIALLQNGQLVDLVSLEEGLAQQGQEYWMHVYTRTEQRPACHINVRNLVPIS